MFTPLLRMIRYSWLYAENHRRKFVAFIVMSFVAHLIFLLSPYVMGEVFNAIQAGGPDVIKNVAFWLVLLALIEATFWAFHGPSRVMERDVAFRARGRLYDAVYDKLRHLPLKWHQDHHSGDTINRTRKAGQAIYDFTGKYFVYIGTVTGLFGPVLILLWVSWPVALVALTMNVVVITALWRFDKAIIYWLDKENTKDHKYSATLFDYMANFTTIITLRLGLRTQAELDKRYEDIWPKYIPHVKINEWKYFILTMSASLMSLIVLLVYIWYELEQKGALMVGTAVAIYRYMDMLRHSFYGFAGAYQDILKQHTDFSSISPVLNAKTAPLQIADKHTRKKWQHMALTNLSFSHESDDISTVNNVTIEATRGKWIALIGESGSGKSTTMALLRGLYEPQKGYNLAFDNKAEDNLTALREMTTLIPQEPEIFENTIHYNITVGLKHTKKDLEQAMKLARFEPVLKKLPQGLETDVREKGVNLSGGEKQRLALARGLFAGKDSDILLLDEATSSVDVHNEMAIFKNIKAAYPDKAVISSVHKLNLMQFFDEVYVMDKGVVVEHGNVDELMKRKTSKLSKIWKKYKDNA